jgi:hypothetical protein
MAEYDTKFLPSGKHKFLKVYNQEDKGENPPYII